MAAVTKFCAKNKESTVQYLILVTYCKIKWQLNGGTLLKTAELSSQLTAIPCNDVIVTENYFRLLG